MLGLQRYVDFVSSKKLFDTTPRLFLIFSGLPSVLFFSLYHTTLGQVVHLVCGCLGAAMACDWMKVSIMWPLGKLFTPCVVVSGLLGWAGTRKVKPIWILLEQVCTSIQTDNHANTPPLSFLQAEFFYRPDALPAAQPTASKHLRHCTEGSDCFKKNLIFLWVLLWLHVVLATNIFARFHCNTRAFSVDVFL